MTGGIISMMTAKKAEATIRALALDSSRIVITDHAEERMEQRDFSLKDLNRVMRLRGSRDAGMPGW